MVGIFCTLLLSEIYGSGYGLVCEASTDGLNWINRCESEDISQLKEY